MKILLIKNHLPYPIQSGQDLVDYGLIKALSQKHEIILISPCEPGEPGDETLAELSKLCSEVKAVPFPENHSPVGKLNWRLKRETNFWLKRTPLPVSDYTYGSLRQAIAKTFLRHKIDFAEISFWYMGNYIKEIKPNCPTLLLQQDAEILNHRRQKKSGHPRRVTLRIRDWYTEMSGMLDYEKKVCQDFDWVLFLSKVDMEGEKDRFEIGDRASIIQVPYDIRPEATGGMKAKPHNILFLGGMHTPYNTDSILRFKNSILPIIRAEIPDILLTIVGNPPYPADAAKLASPYIRYKGFQKDLAETFKEYQVLIAPVWTGSGIKTKIIEGIARGMPIVATPIGVEGLELTPEKDFVLAQNNEEFAQKVIRLLKEPDLRQNISINALERFKTSFGFEQVSPKTLAMYDSVLASISNREPTRKAETRANYFLTNS